MLVFSEIGWEIERETYAEELLQKLVKLLEGKDYSFVQELKDRNRGMILQTSPSTTSGSSFSWKAATRLRLNRFH